MNIYVLNINGNSSGEFVQNVLHYDIAETGSVFGPYDYANELLNAWDTSIKLKWKQSLPVGYFISSLSAKKITTPGGPLAVKVYTPGVEQGARGQAAVTGVGACLLFPVFLNAKNVTGRIFLPGIAQTDVADNVYTSGYQTALTALGNQLVTPITLTGSTASCNFAIYNRKAKTGTHASIFRTSTKVGTQRGRYVPIP